MKITLCGSARFEKQFKEANERLSLAGHVVYSLAVYPSDKSGKDWYTPEQKSVLDAVHLAKIDASDAVYVITDGNGYVGQSTLRECRHAVATGKRVLSKDTLVRNALIAGGVSWQALDPLFRRTCPHEGCPDGLSTGPCGLCYD